MIRRFGDPESTVLQRLDSVESTLNQRLRAIEATLRGMVEESLARYLAGLYFAG